MGVNQAPGCVAASGRCVARAIKLKVYVAESERTIKIHEHALLALCDEDFNRS